MSKKPAYGKPSVLAVYLLQGEEYMYVFFRKHVHVFWKDSACSKIMGSAHKS